MNVYKSFRKSLCATFIRKVTILQVVGTIARKATVLHVRIGKILVWKYLHNNSQCGVI